MIFIRKVVVYRPMVVVYARIVGWVRTALVQYILHQKPWGGAGPKQHGTVFPPQGRKRENSRKFPFSMPVNPCGTVPWKKQLTGCGLGYWLQLEWWLWWILAWLRNHIETKNNTRVGWRRRDHRQIEAAPASSWSSSSGSKACQNL